MSNLEEQNGGAWPKISLPSFGKKKDATAPATETAPATPPTTPTEAKPKGFFGKLGSSIATSVKASTQALGRKIGPGENIIESGLADQYDLMAGNQVAYKKNCLISVNCVIGGEIRNRLKTHIEEGAAEFKRAMKLEELEKLAGTNDVKSLFGIDAGLKDSAARAVAAQKIYVAQIAKPITFAAGAANVELKTIPDPKGGAGRTISGLPCGVFFKKGDKGTGDILGEGLITKIDAPSKLFYVTVTNIKDEPGAEGAVDGAVDGASAKKATFVKENIIVKFDQLCIGGDVARLAYNTCSAKPFDKPAGVAVGGGLNNYVDELLSETSEINDQFGGRKKTKTKKNKNNDNLSVSTEDGLCE